MIIVIRLFPSVKLYSYNFFPPRFLLQINVSFMVTSTLGFLQYATKGHVRQDIGKYIHMQMWQIETKLTKL